MLANADSSTAVDAHAAHVMFVAELDRLLHELILVRVPVGPVEGGNGRAEAANEHHDCQDAGP
jgi:hypothetical protein